MGINVVETEEVEAEAEEEAYRSGCEISFDRLLKESTRLWLRPVTQNRPF
jgi:hypothetical protein